MVNGPLDTLISGPIQAHNTVYIRGPIWAQRLPSPDSFFLGSGSLTEKK